MTERLKKVFLSIVFILGYTSLSFELIILRELINFVGSNTLVTSIVIATILLFMSVGYYLGSVIKFNHINIRKLLMNGIKILSIWYIASCTYYLQELYFFLLKLLGISNLIYLVTIFSLIFLALPSVILGFITSVIGRFIHHQNKNYTGRFMAVDTTGSVLGSLVTTLIIMPLLGVSATIILLVALTMITLLFITPRKYKSEHATLFIIILGIVFCLNTESIINPQSNLIKDDAISRIEIIPSDKDLNGKNHSKIMMINTSMSSKISDTEENMFAYMNFINKTFIDKLPKDKKHDILVLGAGGFTVGLNDEFNNYVFLDIDKDLKDISEKLFLEKKLTDNKTFIAQDAYLYMINNTKKYDIILVDIYSSMRSIPMNFVTIEFFTHVKNNLKENGIMIANIITSPDFSTPYSRRIDNTLRQVFPQYLERQIINPYEDKTENIANIEYVYYNYPPDNTVYSINKNTAIYE